MTDTTLFAPYTMGDLILANRIVMAPLTRNRAAEGLVPGPHAAEYYAQRATAGLIIAEATQVSEQAQGYQDTPGVYTDAQVEGWRKVTQAVHDKGGKIYLQLWHVGRVSNSAVYADNRAPVAPSAIRADAKVFVDGGFAEASEPRALELDELPGIIDDFRKSAANAIKAGFDGVEVHGANGYLLEQFAKDGANKRTDSYGGTVQNRARLMLEVTAAVAKEIGAGRTGIRISPVTPAGGISCSDPQPQFDHIVAELAKMGLAYLHVVEGATGGPRDVAPFDYAALRKAFGGTYIANNGYDLDMAQDALAHDRADLICFGRPFIANPDLVARLQNGTELAEINPDTLYGGGAEGYTDYPKAS